MPKAEKVRRHLKKKKKSRKHPHTRPAEGFGDSKRSGAYRSHDKEWKYRGMAFMKPMSNQSVKDDSVLHFHLKVRPDQIIRFLPNPFKVKYYATHPNPAPDSGKTGDVAAATWRTTPIDCDPRVFIEPALGGAALIERVDVSINGYPVKAYEFGAFHHAFQTINRTFMTELNRMARYGEAFFRTRTTSERKLPPKEVPAADADAVAKAAVAKKNREGRLDKSYVELKGAMHSMQHAGKTTTEDLVSFFNVDGVWPLDSGNSNLLRATTKEKKEEGWLPPNTEIHITVYKRDPLTSLVENAQVVDEVEYGTQLYTPDDSDVVTLVMTELEIHYEEGSLHDQAHMDRMKKGTSYYSDVPTVTAQRVADGAAATSDDVVVPPKTKLGAFTWMKSHHLWHDKGSNRSMSARFSFPPNATRVKMGFRGQKPLYYEDGFDQLGTDQAHYARTSEWYHANLIKRKLYTAGFNRMFPVPTSDKFRSYDQVLFAFLDEVRHKEGEQKIVFDCLYDSNLSGKQWYLVSIFLQQFKFTVREGKPVTWELV